jgi:hypothetical protein
MDSGAEGTQEAFVAARTHSMGCEFEKCIGRATRDDAEAIHALRLEEFQRADEFEVVEPTALHWDETDDRDLVLAAWDEQGRAISTMRGGIVKDRQEAEQRMECSVPLHDSVFPTFLLGRGATRKEFREKGLNSALRYHFYSMVPGTTIRSILGGVYLHAPRTELMRSLGYTFYTPERIWRTDLHARRPQLVASLDASKVIDACEKLRAMLGTVLLEYPWHGERPRLDPSDY